MPQAVWTGELSFGLVNIPVKLYSATTTRRVRFHQYDAETGRRIQYRRVATGPAPDRTPPSDEPESEPWSPREVSSTPRPDASDTEPPGDPDVEREVPWDDIVKGFEIEPGRVVTVTPDELASVAPRPSRVLEVEQLVDLQDIDPVHFEKSYYVVPQYGRGAERPYWLLYRAMEAAAKVAVGRFVMRTKEYLAAVRPTEHVLVLETLFYADEVRDPKEVWVPLIAEPSEQELGVAHQFIEALAGDWEPARLRNEYRERLLDLLHDKVDQALVLPEHDTEPETSAVIDMMEALRASVQAAKAARSREPTRSESVGDVGLE